MKLKIIAMVLCLSTFAFSVQMPVFVQDIRALGMGGAYTAVADDSASMMYNPAGLAKAGFSIRLFPNINVETNQKSLDFIQWFIDNNSRLTGGDLTTWTSADIDRLSNAGLRVYLAANSYLCGIPTPIGNLSVGAYGVANVDVAMVADIFNINAKITTNIDAMVPISLGTMVNIEGINNFFDQVLGGGRLGVGATVKFIDRWKLEESRSVFDLTSIDPRDFANRLINPQVGFGVDLGLNYYLGTQATIGVAFRDVYTKIGTETVDGNIDVGIALKPDWIKGIADLTLALDVRGVLNDLTIMNKLHMGAQAKITMIPIITPTVRIGAYQGWSSFGIGLDIFGLFNVEYATYGVELGLYPGQIEDRIHRVLLTFMFM